MNRDVTKKMTAGAIKLIRGRRVNEVEALKMREAQRSTGLSYLPSCLSN